METIIDNMDDEDFEGLTLFSYTFAFKNMNNDQKEYVTEQFHDWSWAMGLQIAELVVTQEKDDTKFIFKSPKSFEDKDQPQWNENDVHNNILLKLIGKEQFIPGFNFSECGLENLEIYFYDDKNNMYDVKIDKYSSLIKKS